MKHIIIPVGENPRSPEIDLDEESKNMVQDIIIALQQKRISEHISLNELAKRIGVSHTTIMRIEHFAASPTLPILTKMILALNFQLNMIDRDDEDEDESLQASILIEKPASDTFDNSELSVERSFNLQEMSNRTHLSYIDSIALCDTNCNIPICIDGLSEQIRHNTIIAQSHIDRLKKAFEEIKNRTHSNVNSFVEQSNTDGINSSFPIRSSLQDDSTLMKYSFQKRFFDFLLILWRQKQVLPSDETYIEYLDQFSDYYYDLAESFGFLEGRIQTSKAITNQFILAIKEYYDGQHSSAYSLFCEALQQLPLDLLYSTLKTGTKMYRARYKRVNHNYTKEDFFHVPFEMRTKISSQRYSYPGRPCLYAGSSPDVCIKELACTYNDAIYSEIKIHNNQTCIVFDLTKMYEKKPWELSESEQRDFFELFPLSFLCSTTLQSGLNPPYLDRPTERSFRPDYIISQLLLEYVIDKNTFSKTKVLGIAYFSVKTDYLFDWLSGDVEKLKNEINYAFPTRTTKANGFCDFLQQYLYVGKIHADYEKTMKEKNFFLLSNQYPPTTHCRSSI